MRRNWSVDLKKKNICYSIYLNTNRNSRERRLHCHTKKMIENKQETLLLLRKTVKLEFGSYMS